MWEPGGAGGGGGGGRRYTTTKMTLRYGRVASAARPAGVTPAGVRHAGVYPAGVGTPVMVVATGSIGIPVIIVCGITVSDLGIFGMNIGDVIVDNDGVITVSLVIDTDDPNCGILIGVDVTSSDGDDDGMSDVTVLVFAGIGAMVIFFKPTFFSMVAALVICVMSVLSSGFSTGTTCLTDPPFPSIA